MNQKIVIAALASVAVIGFAAAGIYFVLSKSPAAFVLPIFHR